MARNASVQTKVGFTVLAWAVALLLFSPILWTIVTAFKTEAEAIASPPSLVAFRWTLENYVEVNARSDYFLHFMNSVVISLGSTLLGLLTSGFCNSLLF